MKYLVAMTLFVAVIVVILFFVVPYSVVIDTHKGTENYAQDSIGVNEGKSVKNYGNAILPNKANNINKTTDVLQEANSLLATYLSYKKRLFREKEKQELFDEMVKLCIDNPTYATAIYKLIVEQIGGNISERLVLSIAETKNEALLEGIVYLLDDRDIDIYSKDAIIRTLADNNFPYTIRSEKIISYLIREIEKPHSADSIRDASIVDALIKHYKYNEDKITNALIGIVNSSYPRIKSDGTTEIDILKKMAAIGGLSQIDNPMANIILMQIMNSPKAPHDSQEELLQFMARSFLAFSTNNSIAIDAIIDSISKDMVLYDEKPTEYADPLSSITHNKSNDPNIIRKVDETLVKFMLDSKNPVAREGIALNMSWRKSETIKNGLLDAFSRE